MGVYMIVFFVRFFCCGREDGARSTRRRGREKERQRKRERQRKKERDREPCIHSRGGRNLKEVQTREIATEP